MEEHFQRDEELFLESYTGEENLIDRSSEAENEGSSVFIKLEIYFFISFTSIFSFSTNVILILYIIISQII